MARAIDAFDASVGQMAGLPSIDSDRW